eukprot:g1343.t1
MKGLTSNTEAIDRKLERGTSSVPGVDKVDGSIDPKEHAAERKKNITRTLTVAEESCSLVKEGNDLKNSESSKKNCRTVCLADFKGWWKLDVARSDTMELYLEAMGLSTTAIKAALKTELEFPSFQFFQIEDDSIITIKRKSRLSRQSDMLKGQRLILGKTTTSEKSGYIYRDTARLRDNCVLEITTERPVSGKLIKLNSTRTLVEQDGDGVPNTICHIIFLQTENKCVTVKRWWRRFTLAADTTKP